MQLSAWFNSTSRSMAFLRSFSSPVCQTLSSSHFVLSISNQSKGHLRSYSSIVRCENSFFQKSRSVYCVPRRFSHLCCEELLHRDLLKVTGPDAFSFLQGLITNDVRLLESTDKPMSQYAMILNSKGRVLYDVLLYKIQNKEPTVLLECNSDVKAEIMSTLQKYKLRKKLTLSDIKSDYRVFAVFNKELTSSLSDLPPLKFRNDVDVCFHGVDPRIQTFGYRVVTSSNINVAEILDDCESVTGVYDSNRYKTGLSEGTTDLPPSECLPLESNIVFLNGVTFDKGCYVGQELTARTHHTGVIRKRLMPIVLLSDEAKVKADHTVENDAGKACGKIKNTIGKHGLALLRLEEVIGKEKLIIKDGEEVVAEATTFIPSWWNVDSDAVLRMIAAKKQSNEETKT